MKPIVYPDADLSCGLSTRGILICGDKESIRKVRDALHAQQDVVPWMRAEIERLHELLKIYRERDIIDKTN